MATIDDLDREVHRLRRRVNELENGPAKRERAEREALVGQNEDDRLRHGGGFARACQESRANLVREELDEAIEQLAMNPHCADTPVSEHAFRRSFSAVPSTELEKILEKARGS